MAARNAPQPSYPLARAGRLARVLGPISGLGAALTLAPGAVGRAGALLAVAAGTPVAVLAVLDMRRWLLSTRR